MGDQQAGDGNPRDDGASEPHHGTEPLDASDQPGTARPAPSEDTHPVGTQPAPGQTSPSLKQSAERKPALSDLLRDGPPVGPTRRGFWRSPLRGPWLTSVLGAVLLAGIVLMFVTGLLSYAAYNRISAPTTRPRTGAGSASICSPGPHTPIGCTGSPRASTSRSASS